MKKDREKLTNQKNAVAKKILSPARAHKIAENIFVRGGWKKYREDIRHFANIKIILQNI